MKDFNIEKKGYSKKEVDDYLILQQIENDRLLKEKQSRINELREENFNLSKELKLLKEKEASVSEVLIVATQEAKEIKEKAKLEYSLELNNLDLFYKKWNDFLQELIIRYPKMKDFDTKDVLNNIKTEMGEILNGTFQIKKTTKKQNDFKTLIDKLHAHSNNKKEKSKLKINKDIKNKDIITDSENEVEYQIEKNKFNNIKPITNLTISSEEKEEFENLVDKFLHTDNKISQGYKNSILNTKKKKIEKYPKPNESGFDLEQALNPTEDLFNIMKGFKLDE